MKKYEPSKIEMLRLEVYDIITSSVTYYPDDEEDYGGIGGGYNPNGWT